MVSVDPILTTGASGLSVTWPQKVVGALHGLDDAWLVLLAMELVWQLYYIEPMDYPCKPQLDNVKLPLTCLCLAVRLKNAKSSQSMRLTFYGVQKYCFDYTGVTLDDVCNHMVALRGVLHTLSEERKSLGELWDDMYNSAMLLFFIGVAIVGVVICFSENIDDHHPVRVAQQAAPKPPQSRFRTCATTC